MQSLYTRYGTLYIAIYIDEHVHVHLISYPCKFFECLLPKVLGQQDKLFADKLLLQNLWLP